jgi:hypothetical protein
MSEEDRISSMDIAGQDIRLDPHNLNLGTDRGRSFIKSSIARDGFGRPVFAANDGTVIGGNHAMKTIDELKKEGREFGDPIIVRSRGDRPIIHIREDIPTAEDPRAKRMGIADNRATELNYSPDIAAMVEVLDTYNIAAEDVGYTVEELQYEPVVAPASPEAPPRNESGGSGFGAGPESIGERYQVVIDAASEDEQRRIFEQLTQQGFSARVITL